ncbi:MAG: ATP-binding protein [Alphaproteobacteria bacterium]
MFFLKNASIKKRLTSIIMAISCSSVLLTTLAISVMGVYSLRASIVDELLVMANIVGDRNAAALTYEQYDLAERNLEVLSGKQTIRLGCLYKESGELFAAYKKSASGDTLECPEILEERAVIKEYIEIMKPIVTVRDQVRYKVGYIYVEATLEDINKYIEKQTMIAFLVVLAAVLVSYFLAINLQRAISRPILSLADTARQISIHKDYAIRAPSIGDAREEFNNELVILTNSFNDMLTEIGERDTQLKKQNIDLEKAKDEAEAANRAKSQFLANISHELRTPLNAIIGFSSILMNQLFGSLGDAKYLEYAKDINESGAHLLDIINDILDLSKAEAGKLKLNFEEVHVGKSINKCLTIVAERAEKGKVAISTDIPKTLPPLVADRLRFIQIVLNVLSNAVKFTGEGGKVHLTVATQGNAGTPTHFVVKIQDTGIGMSKEDVDKAFQSFGQVDSGLNRKYEGTGLGLPLTKRLVDLHYGRILLESELGQGTLVTLTFPMVPPPESGYVPEV